MDDFAVIPDEALDSPWRDADLARLTLHIVSWEELAPFWGLTEAEEEVIKRDNSKYAAQKLTALHQEPRDCHVPPIGKSIREDGEGRIG